MYLCIYYLLYVISDLNSAPSIKELSNLVTPDYAAKWKAIGLKLGVKKSNLDIIERDYGRNAEMCCNEMFGKWLDTNTNITWKNVLESLKYKTIPQMEKPFSTDGHITKGMHLICFVGYYETKHFGHMILHAWSLEITFAIMSVCVCVCVCVCVWC